MDSGSHYYVLFKLVGRHEVFVIKLGWVYLEGRATRSSCKFVDLRSDCQLWHFKTTQGVAESTFFDIGMLRVTHWNLNLLLCT